YIRLTSRVGKCTDDLNKLALLDPEQENVYAAIEWLSQQQRHQDTIHLAQEVSYYYFVRGEWIKGLRIDTMHAVAARSLNMTEEELLSLSYVIQLLIRQDRITDAEEYLIRLNELSNIDNYPENIRYEFLNTMSHYLIVKGDIDRVNQIWNQNK